MKSLSLLFTLLFSISAFAEIPLHYYRLDNGLQVVLSVNNNLPVVNQTLWYRVGSMDEERGESGKAHILEHLMFKGTKQHGDGYFSKTLQELGGVENATTSRYYTNYYQTISSQHWETLAKLESDRMRNLDFANMEIAPEIDVVFEERLARVENNPHAILAERSAKALHGNHPQGQPVIGWGHELLGHKKKLQGLQDFYDYYYTPENAILVISGDIDLDTAKATIQKTFGAIPKSKKPAALDIIEPTLPSGQLKHELTLTHRDVTQPFFFVSMLSPSIGYNDKQDERIALKESDILPLMIIADVMNSPDSELQKHFVREKKSALGLEMYYSPLGRGAATLSLYFVPKDKDMQAMRTALQDKLREIAEAGLTAEALESAKLRITDSVLLSYDSLAHYPNVAAQAMVSGMEFNDFLSWQDRLGQVSLAEVNQTLRHYFGGENLVGVWSYLQGE